METSQENPDIRGPGDSLLPLPDVQTAEEDKFTEAALEEAAAAVIALLPPLVVMTRHGAIHAPFVRSVVAQWIWAALRDGHHVDRSNGDGPLEEWDGWLRIDFPEEPVFLKIRS